MSHTMGLPPQYHNGLYSNTLLLDYTTNEIHGVRDYMMYTIALMSNTCCKIDSVL